ncbi:MAG: HAD family hydrolase [Clostridiales bacterium]|nr:HAD family hydrolase [Clostridiales bacterium]
MIPQDYPYLLFDLDGTLTDPAEGITKCVQYALESFGIKEPDRTKLKRFIGPPLIDSFQEFYGMKEEQALQAVSKYRERFKTVGLYENKVYPGVKEMLEELQAEGKILGVATSKPDVFANRILEHFGLSRYFTVICGASLDHKVLSTKAAVIREALSELKIRPEETEEKVLMIGDRKHDILGAREAGICCLGVEFGYAEPGELKEYGASYIVQTVAELHEILHAGKKSYDIRVKS